MTTTRLFQFDLTPAFHAFFSAIAAAQQRSETPESMEAVVDVTRGRLDHQWETLTHLARAGLEDQMRASLDVLLREWALKEALELLLRKGGTVIDPADQGLRNRFWQVLTQQHQVLAGELMLYWHQGQQAHEQAQANRPKNWEEFAWRVLEHQHGQQQYWQGAAFHMLQEQRTAWQTGQQIAEQWSQVALSSIVQAQQGVQQLYNIAATMHSHVADMLAATEERHSLVVEGAVDRARRRRMTRLTVVLIMAVSVPALFALAYFLITHLY
jgi:hypothetical protein